MAKRSDKHAPSTFDPAKYIYEGTVVLAPPRIPNELRLAEPAVADAILEEYKREREELIERCKAGGHVGNFLNKGTCDHCGAYFIYGAEFKHHDGDTIVVGHICADEAFGCLDRREYDMKAAKARTKASRTRIKKLGIRLKWLEENALEDVFSAAHRGDDSKAGDILSDLYSNLYEWGSLTPKQVELARKLADRIDNPKPTACDFCGREGHKAKECENRATVPNTGKERIEIKARIISARSEESYFNGHARTVYKALYETPTGYRLWGTVPSALLDELFWNKGEHGDSRNDKTIDDLRGMYVEFTAAISRSDRDPTFGFVKRPTKAGFIERFENEPVFPAADDRSDTEIRAALIAARKTD